MVKWKYKIDLNDDTVFNDVEKLTQTKVPEDLIKLIQTANAASPDENTISINDNERIFASVLSFNRQDEEPVDDVYTAIKAMNKKGFIPFGIDPFGNYFCFESKTQTVVFWDHEKDEVEDSHLNVSDFIQNLHKKLNSQ